VGWAKVVSVVMFGFLAAFLVYIGSRKDSPSGAPPPPPTAPPT
jgi:hypothetical protein